MLRILHLDDARSWRGGEQQVLYLHRGLRARGVDSLVVCPPDSAFAERLQRESLPFAPLPQRGSFDIASAWRLGEWARRPDCIVHTHTSHAHSLALLACSLRHAFPLIVSRRVDFAIGRRSWGRRKYLDPRILRYLAISSGVEDALLEGGVPSERIRRVPSGVDLERFVDVRPAVEFRAELAFPPDALLLGNVAALAPHKDQVTLLRAFSRMLREGVDAYLVILGEGELRPRLEALVSELDLNARVRMPGFVQDILPRVAALDLFVMSSRLEGLGTSILDAMALGKAVVATAVGGIPDAVAHEESGLLVPAEDPAALAAALTRVATDDALRARLGARGSERVRLFDVQTTVELTLSVYEEVARELQGAS